MKRDTELRQERDRELYSIYVKGLNEQNFENTHEAADWARSQPASKFFISSKSLVNYIGQRLANAPLTNMFEENRRRMEYLYGLYLDFIANNPNTTLSRERICEILVESPAPMFFIGHESAIKIILRERASAKKQFIDRYCL